MARRSSLDLLDPTRRVLMTILKRHGQASTETLAAEAFLSIGATRQHMQALVDQGLAAFDLERRGPGRPRHLFSLTQAGETLFPQVYEDVAEAVVAAVEAEDPAVRDRVFEKVGQALLRKTLIRLESVDPAVRFKEAIASLEESGYYPEVTYEDSIARVSFLNCPLISVAQQHPAICEAESRCLMLALGGESVRRIALRTAGEGPCTYIVPIPAQ